MDTFTPMSVAVLVKIPPRLAVARAIAIDVVLFAIMAAVHKKCTPSTRRVKGRTCDSVPGLQSMELEGRSEFAHQFSQLTEGIRSDVPGLIGLRYCNPVVGAPQQVLRVIQTCAWEPSRNLLDVTFFQGLRDDVYVCVGRLRKECGPWLVALKK